MIQSAHQFSETFRQQGVQVIDEAQKSSRPRATSTIKDVARQAGVAFSTASVVLNNKPKSIGSATRERIWTAARELGYQPNPTARALVTKRMHIIGLWTTDVASAFSARIIAEIQRQAQQHGYEVLISEVHLDDLSATGGYTTAPLASNMRRSLWHVDGVITYLGLACRGVERNILPLRETPVVNLGTACIDGADFVGVDLEPGAIAAMRHLVASGCKHIAYLVPARIDFPGDTRREAYLKVVREAGIEPCVIDMRQGGDSETRAAARAAMVDALQKNDRIDGVFCFNDECSIGAYRALRDLGLRIPDDVALIGCNGIEDTKYLDCPLSTIVLPVAEMCATAWTFLENRIEAPDAPRQEIIMPANLELRESVRPC